MDEDFFYVRRDRRPVLPSARHAIPGRVLSKMSDHHVATTEAALCKGDILRLTQKATLLEVTKSLSSTLNDDGESLAALVMRFTFAACASRREWHVGGSRHDHRNMHAALHIDPEADPPCPLMPADLPHLATGDWLSWPP